TGNFTVEAPEIPLKPAEFIVSDLSIEPKEVVLEEGVDAFTFSITVKVANIGEQEGTHTVNLKVDGDVIQAGTVTLWGGEETSITFDVTRGEGTYEVEVEEFTGSFMVEPYPIPPTPAEFVFSNLEMTPDEDLTITISVNATNDGEETGSYIVRLKLDEVVI
ncbi:unnamed protein product, partial [marine sediment metagenome]